MTGKRTWGLTRGILYPYLALHNNDTSVLWKTPSQAKTVYDMLSLWLQCQLKDNSCDFTTTSHLHGTTWTQTFPEDGPVELEQMTSHDKDGSQDHQT